MIRSCVLIYIHVSMVLIAYLNFRFLIGPFSILSWDFSFLDSHLTGPIPNFYILWYWAESVAYFFIRFNHFSRYVEENALLYWTVCVSVGIVTTIVPIITKLSLVGMQLREKYKEKFDISSEGPSRREVAFARNVEFLLVFFRYSCIPTNESLFSLYWQSVS
jgi:hypothetical protein